MTLFGLPVCIFHTLRNIAAMVFFAVFANQRLFVKTMYILPIHTSSLLSPQMIFRTLATVVVAIFAVEVVRADMYLHNMRGSNNRLDEARRDRNNANRYVCIQHSPLFLFPFEKKCFFFLGGRKDSTRLNVPRPTHSLASTIVYSMPPR